MFGVSDARIRGWVESRYLTRRLPKVFAVGHDAPNRAALLWEAVLYAGPGAMLSHMTAAQWRGLIQFPPKLIEVSTPRKARSLPGIRVYGRRLLDRDFHDGLPVTTIAQSVLDLAAGGDLQLVRRALAVLDFRDRLDFHELLAICGSGRPGSVMLHRALAVHDPQLAYLNGELEVRFYRWCEEWDVPLPLVGRIVHGIRVDAHWPDRGVVAELDGDGNHHSAAQRRRDRARDLILRSHGLVVLRYDWELVKNRPQLVYEDLMAHLTARAGWRGAA
jgi:hypothetical protein